MTLRVDPANRYSTLQLIPWWQVETLQKARVLVVGAGALGNEVLKNLALLGIGNIWVCDFDEIETGNLTRSVLFREGDIGKSKAELAAKRVREINPDVRVRFSHGNVFSTLGLGVYRRMDAVLGCVDNTEARVWINAQCQAVSKVWIDAAIDVLFGEVRVFVPEDGSACFECGLEDSDYLLMNSRYSCTLLAREQLTQGRQPTTPIVSSVIGALQVQEAVKYLHGIVIEPGIIHFNGQINTLHKVSRARRADCPGHDPCSPIVECPDLNNNSTLRDVVDAATRLLGPSTRLELDRQLLIAFRCAHCGYLKSILRPLRLVAESEALCPVCKAQMQPRTTYQIDGSEVFAEQRLEQIGIPPLHLIRACSKSDDVYLETTGDALALFDAYEWSSKGS